MRGRFTMGEMADFSIEQGMEDDEAYTGYQRGGISLDEAYDRGFIDDLGFEAAPVPRIRTVGNVTCVHCGEANLTWMTTAQGWRTSKNKVMHQCPAFKKPRKTAEEALEEIANASMSQFANAKDMALKLQQIAQGALDEQH